MKFLAVFRAAAFLTTATQFADPVAAQDKGLAAPTGLRAAQTSPTEITLVWDAMPSALGFRIYSKSGVIASLSKTATHMSSQSPCLAFRSNAFSKPLVRRDSCLRRQPFQW